MKIFKTIQALVVGLISASFLACSTQVKTQNVENLKEGMPPKSGFAFLYEFNV